MATGVEYTQTTATLNEIARVLKLESLELCRLLDPGGGGSLPVKVDQEGVHLALNGEVSRQIGADGALPHPAFLVADQDFQPW